ncbi:hypothetical protein [Cellulomonas xiejunii]|uniref:hypothetical protein n=1 Tax=Cellulomonas xiejunii TaxID=2968083 RepID=UPI001D0E89F8|nr:hypothetical protein [Cellulomonas xiejunii]MCC2313547.1 hypothetical protein [Cellulomonas xiejunii]
MSEQPHDSQDASDAAAKKQKSEGGAYLAIGLAFIVLGITQLGGDGAAWGISYLGVGVVFMTLSGRKVASPSSRPGQGEGPGTGSSDRPDAQGDDDAR